MRIELAAWMNILSLTYVKLTEKKSILFFFRKHFIFSAISTFKLCVLQKFCKYDMVQENIWIFLAATFQKTPLLKNKTKQTYPYLTYPKNSVCASKLKTETTIISKTGFPAGATGKESPCQCRRHKRHGFNSWVRKIRWRRAWQPPPPPVFLSGESHGQRSLEGYSPWGHKESDMTDVT